MGTCGWDVSYSACAGSADQAFIDSLDPEVLKKAEKAAVAMLDSWTGERFGQCDGELSLQISPGCHPSSRYHTAVTPNRGTLPTIGAPAGIPALLGGTWYNLGCGGCAELNRAGDRYLPIELPQGVSRLTEIVLDGKPLMPVAKDQQHGVWFLHGRTLYVRAELVESALLSNPSIRPIYSPSAPVPPQPQPQPQPNPPAPNPPAPNPPAPNPPAPQPPNPPQPPTPRTVYYTLRSLGDGTAEVVPVIPTDPPAPDAVNGVWEGDLEDSENEVVND